MLSTFPGCFTEKQILHQKFLSASGLTELQARLNAALDFFKSLGQEDNALHGLDRLTTQLASPRFLAHKNEVCLEKERSTRSA